MKKTVILTFIHGFKGGESTFGDEYQFTEHLRDMVAQRLPKVDVRVLVYPKYETRGDLGSCVSRFRSWLEDKVIDLEVAAGTTSPTVDPSVRTVLVGHSMGGIVAAEMVIGLASEKPIYSEDGIEKTESPAFNSLMFPYVQGVLALDTPFLGISPGVLAHGAEGHYQNAAAAVSQLSGLSSVLWGSPTSSNNKNRANDARMALPSSSQAAASTTTSGAAGGAAAWVNREQLTTGWTWVSSHLEFVGCLARPEQLKKRMECMAQLGDELDVGFANLYTRLGRAAPATYVSVAGTVLGHERTFCNLPKKLPAGEWAEAVNDKAQDEASAHMNMFEPKENPRYEKLAQDAAGLIEKWFQNDWYYASSEDEAQKVEEVNEPHEVEEIPPSGA
ncbi:alpha/beta-Hydrolase [Hirsutella rhossiliensis]|uniref:Alpha/beta-Hydrolase n=1 Tax=Hirsutella rhossiliensis TaxID=111463 RepID=A0A9P8SJC7_9HYPO|nr:alpha/beta-Hydrolase [Hirsutella rhossiliensis]KAH0962916.1 alpha/beta-Hydrolase [Hirsutella rhossiliensis]